ncbi:MAG: four helix bundle protein [Chloroflexota bacterium]
MAFRSSQTQRQVFNVESLKYFHSSISKNITFITDTEKQELGLRTKKFALQIIRLYQILPKTTEAQVLGNQVLRSGTSVGAHYREASHARSQADFISKIQGGLQEMEETHYWLQLLTESDIIAPPHFAVLRQEAQELLTVLRQEAQELLVILIATVNLPKSNR